MANESKSKTKTSPNKELDFNALVPQKYSLDAYARKIIKEKDPKNLASLINEFRAISLKKEIIRVVKLSEFLDLADEEVGKRLSTYPERLKNSEVVEFSKILQDSLDRSNKQIDMIQEDAIKIPSSASTVNVTKNEVNVNLTTASREKITNIIRSIMNSGALDKEIVPSGGEDTVDVTPVEEKPASDPIDNDEAQSYFSGKEDED